MPHSDQIYSLIIYKLGEYSAKQMLKLKEFFGNFETAFFASPKDWQEAKISDRICNQNTAQQKNIDPIIYFEKFTQNKIKIIDFHSPIYPQLLKEISDPPYFLFCRGNVELLNKNSLAIVGTRKITSYGRQILNSFVPQIVKNDFVIISGLAFGVDTMAHAETVRNNGETIAVLGTAINQIYPAENKKLAEDILTKNGLIISEYPIDSLTQKFSFAKRNRIISGLCFGTLIIEAPLKSGSLITAQCALDQNREVFCVPGSIFSQFSEGTNNLLKNGAQLISNVEDIFENLQTFTNSPKTNSPPYLPNDPIEATILSNLTENRHINELAQLCQISISELNAKLMVLEIKNAILNLGNNIYIKK
ncbi:MAG: DNA-processing protein DprA [Patescibacteria group bacterium]